MCRDHIEKSTDSCARNGRYFMFSVRDFGRVRGGKTAGSDQGTERARAEGSGRTDAGLYDVHDLGANVDLKLCFSG